jgi:hypothetical protein
MFNCSTVYHPDSLSRAPVFFHSLFLYTLSSAAATFSYSPSFLRTISPSERLICVLRVKISLMDKNRRRRRTTFEQLRATVAANWRWRREAVLSKCESHLL